MNIFRFVLVTALGLGLSSTGCLGNTDPLVEDIEPPRFKTLVDPGGGINPNGLPPAFFHANKFSLIQAMHLPLVAGEGSSQISNGILNTSLLESDAGKTTFRYAMNCALSSLPSVFGDTVDDNDNIPGQYDGAGLLTTTGGWLTGGLQMGPKQDIFACLLAHLNPAPVPVHILVSGASVDDKSTEQLNQDDFSFDEAVWSVSFASSFAPILTVWPLGDLVTACGRSNVIPILQTRVCGFEGPDPTMNCGVHFRVDLDTACEKSGGHYNCGGQPAIRTRLKPEDVSKLHGGCGL